MTDQEELSLLAAAYRAIKRIGPITLHEDDLVKGGMIIITPKGGGAFTIDAWRPNDPPKEEP